MNDKLSPADKLYFLKAVNRALLEIEQLAASAKACGSLNLKRSHVQAIRDTTDRILHHLGGDL